MAVASRCLGPRCWLSGFDTVPLSRCTVQDINNPDSSAPKPGSFTNVYVDVTCLNHQDD